MPLFRVQYVETYSHYTVIEAPSIEAVHTFVQDGDNLVCLERYHPNYESDVRAVVPDLDSGEANAHFCLDADGKEIP